MLAIRAARLFDGVAGRLRARPLVLVDEGRITDVDTTGADPLEGAALVDLGEATLLPGLIDSHTHLVLDASNDPVGHLADIDEDSLLEQCRARGIPAATLRDRLPSSALDTNEAAITSP
jgi:imidazolonepropionase-like amidohydrolase